MPERHGHHGPPWGGGPPGFGPGFGPGRRFRRGALIALTAIVLFVAALASVAASIISGNAPAPRITIAVSAVVVVGLILSARWLWRSARTFATLMDAADRVADGEYTVRVPHARSGQLRRLTDAFNQMAERLQTNEERRRELLADVAHELRTPLQVIRGTVEGMLDGLYPADAERLRPLVEETDVMARLLDDLRTLSMAEGGVLQLHLESVDPRGVAEDVVQAFRSMADAAGVMLEATGTAGAPARIEADPVRLGEILTNLVANAVRHTPRTGRVAVRLSGDGDAAVFEVTDTGPGIEADRLPFVFDRFVTSADGGGSGLGLAIAKRLTEAHGGTIEVLAPPGGGTTMRFVIPLAPAR